MMMRHLLATTLGLCTLVAAAAEPPFVLIDNFTSPLPSSDQVQSQTITANPHNGLAMAQLDYQMDERNRRAELNVDRDLPGTGQLRLWVKGNPEAKHDIQLRVRHAKVYLDSRGNERQDNRRDEWLERIPLDFEGWRELSFTVKGVPKDHKVWLTTIVLHKRADDSAATGSISIDDLRLIPDEGKPQMSVLHGLIGPKTRSFSEEIELYCDFNNFTKNAGRVQVRVNITDRNENPIVDRDFTVDLKGNDRQEIRLPLNPENLQLYLPPFHISGDILSTDLPAASGRIDHTLVMANARSQWETFAAVDGRWITSGWDKPEGFTNQQHRQWLDWLMGEGPRVTAVTQNRAQVTRVALPPAKAGEAAPTGQYALKVDYRDNAEVYNARPRIPRELANPHTGDRFLPGNAFRCGFWVYGDGSGALVRAQFLDYSDMADFWSGGWKRTQDGTRDLCRLDFTGWRYVEVDLPGNGIGGNERTGSSQGIDFPIELSAIRIQSWSDEKERDKLKEEDPKRVFQGTVLFGPIEVLTQQAASDALILQVGYDDPMLHYAATHNASFTIQNSSLGTARNVGLSWAVLDRAGDVMAKGNAESKLPPGQAASHSIDLAAQAASLKGHLGPYKLQVTAYDKQDAAVSAVREVMLAVTDSNALLADFELDRPFYGFEKGADPVAATSTDKAHSGKRSLAIDWNKTDKARMLVAVDPVLPGTPTTVSFWVHGDKSGALLYPIFGDRRGVPNGKSDLQYDLLPGLTQDAHNAVVVDWDGWRELTFELPPVPTGWDSIMPVLGYLPSYPLTLMLGIDAASATKDQGRIFVDDIRVDTHLPVAERLALGIEHNGLGNLLPTKPELRMVVDSYERQTPRQVQLRARLTDWRGQQVDAFEESFTVKPGERTHHVFAPKLGTGAYSLLVELREGDTVVREYRNDLVVADLKPVLGDTWRDAMRDEWQLRKPLNSLYTFIDEDWDWIEQYPGNIQTESLRVRAGDVREHGAEPWLLLGYSAYYAAGPGMEQVKAHSFERRKRDIGHAVDIFLVPERIEDWENYVRELMRDAADSVNGWVLWNNPDAAGGSLAVAPEKFAEMYRAADKWRMIYCPEKPLLIGGMTSGTAIPYLQKLDEIGVLKEIYGVNVRLDVGVRSPEDADVKQYISELQQTLKTDATHPGQILITDLDWAVERSADGLGEFDQAAYLIRAALLLAPFGITPEVSIANGDFSRLGLGLTYKDKLDLPPQHITLPELRLKAGWLGLAKTREWLKTLTYQAELEVQDVVSQRTRALWFKRADGKPAVFLWRNNDPGFVSFAHTGMTVSRAEDLLGTPVPAADGAYAIGKMPVLFFLEPGATPQDQGLARIWVRDGAEFTWAQRVVAAITPTTAPGFGYAADKGEAATVAARNLTGDTIQLPIMKVAAGGAERFNVPVEAGKDLILRKRFYLDDAGQELEVWINGKKAGDWNLKRSDAQLSSGLRESLYIVPAATIGAGTEAKVELRYTSAGNTAAWFAFTGQETRFPLTAVGGVHIDQAVSYPRPARNMAGETMKIGETAYTAGIGVYAPSLMEIALNGQFKRFTAMVGVDAATDGRGSVAFEIYADGKKVWSTPVMSGLDAAREVDLDVSGVQRLRLVVTDGGDGNRLDAANWADATLTR